MGTELIGNVNGTGRGDLRERVMTATNVETHVRYGVFLRTIPPARRVGDYCHAAARIVNAIFKRLLAAAPHWGHRAATSLRPVRHQIAHSPFAHTHTCAVHWWARVWVHCVQRTMQIIAGNDVVVRGWRGMQD